MLIPPDKNHFNSSSFDKTNTAVATQHKTVPYSFDALHTNFTNV